MIELYDNKDFNFKIIEIMNKLTIIENRVESLAMSLNYYNKTKYNTTPTCKSLTVLEL